MLMASVGAAVGALVFGLFAILVPPKPSTLVRLGRFDAQLQQSSGASLPDGATARSDANGGAGARLLARVGAAVVSQMRRRGWHYTSLRQDLALTGQTLESVIGRKLLGLGSGFFIVIGTAVGLQVSAGISLPVGSPLLLAVVFGAVLFAIPGIEARREATVRRRDFRRALSAYLDLVALEMAGSAAATEALPNAARVGSGWAMALLRQTLSHATLARRDQWDALTELGHRIGVTELSDLGTLVQLVGRDGARVRQTLTARAATMRRRDLADAEGEAGQRDQSMLLAQVLIGFGFMTFVGYPAVVALLAI